MDHLLDDLGRDRATPWRRTAQVATAIAVLLALGLGSDWVLRDRVRERIEIGLSTTALQARRAVELLKLQFDASAKQAQTFHAFREVTGKYDNADFGLGDEATDSADLSEVHQQLQSITWNELTVAGYKKSITAVADYKGRMLYSSAAPEVFDRDLLKVPAIRNAFDRNLQTQITLIRFDDPALVETKMLGDTPLEGLGVLFTRTVIVGGTPRSLFIQMVTADQLLEKVDLEFEGLLFSLMAPDGRVQGTAPASYVTHPPEGFVVRTVLLPDSIGQLVMAQELGGALSLFPYARLLFALALIASILVAVGTALRAKQITDARAA